MITVGEILHLQKLQEVKVLSGKSGLIRKIRWVHIIDTDDVGHFLEGGELLLTCGQIWPKDKIMEEKLLKAFKRYQVSGILFAIGRYLTKCPSTVLEFGEKNAIPVLEMPFQVPFVKVTQVIHQEIMNRQHKKFSLIAQVSPELTEELKSANNYIELCDILATFLNCPTVLTDHKNQIITKAIPHNDGSIHILNKIDRLIDIARNDFLDSIGHIYEPGEEVKAIHVLADPPYAMAVPLPIGGNRWGTLWLLHFSQPFTKVHARALEHAANLLIDLVSKHEEQEARRRQLPLELLELLLENPETASIIVEEKIKELGLEPMVNWMAGLLLFGEDRHRSPLKSERESWRDSCHKWIQVTEGITGFCETYEEQLVLFISSNLDAFELQQKFTSLQNHLKNIDKLTSPILVLGEIKHNVLSIIDSYHETKVLALIVQHQSPKGGLYFSDQWRREMTLYGGMSPKKAVEFRNFLLPKELLTEQGSALYETLKCLAFHSYNRDIVAAHLHLHRNTLRYRIKRIEQLLGDSLTSPKCQFWIQVALDLESIAMNFEEINPI